MISFEWQIYDVKSTNLNNISSEIYSLEKEMNNQYVILKCYVTYEVQSIKTYCAIP